MKRGWLATCLIESVIVVSMAHQGWANDPATRGASTRDASSNEQSARVAALVTDLSSDQFETRSAAQKSLVDMGPAIRVQLRQILQGDLPDEARSRIVDALRKIEQAGTLAMITLHYKDAPLLDVLKDFASRSGSDLGLQQANIIRYAEGRKISIDLDDEGFWTSVRAICKESQLVPGLRGGVGGGIALFEPKTGTADLLGPYSAISGSFLFVPVSCTQDRAIKFDQPDAPVATTFQLRMQIVAEPKLVVLSTLNSDWLKTCVDDKGNSLITEITDPFAAAPLPLGVARVPAPLALAVGLHQSAWNITTGLKDVAGIGHKIAKLSGELRVQVQTRADLFEIDSILNAKNTTKMVGGMKYTVVDLVDNGSGGYSLHATEEGPGRGPIARPDIMGRIQVMDDQGQLLRLGGTSIRTAQGTQDITLVLQPLPGGGKPAKLRWEITAEQKEIDVPFEIRDLKLPVGP